MKAIALNTALLDELERQQLSSKPPKKRDAAVLIRCVVELTCWKRCSADHGEGRAGIRTPNSGATSRCLNHLATPAVEIRIYQRLVLLERAFSLPLVLLPAAGALLWIGNPSHEIC